MLTYAVVEIAGKQYKITKDKPLLVDFLGEVKNFECDKVLLKAEDDKVLVGSPYLKEKLLFDVLEAVKGEKIRVATYKAKANTRKVKGFRKISSKIVLNDAKSTSKREK